MLFIASVVLAFAEPYIPQDNKLQDEQIRKRVLIYMDNSYSMQQMGEGGILLQEAKGLAKDIAQAYAKEDEFKLLTNNKSQWNGSFVSREDFISDLRDVAYESFSIQINDLLSTSLTQLLNSDQKPSDVFIISDFQKSILDWKNFPTDSTVNIRFVPLHSARAHNLFIDSLWIETPAVLVNRAIQVNYRLQSNSSSSGINTTLRLLINGKQKGITALDTTAKQLEGFFVFSVDSAGSYQGEIQLEDQPITFDDRFYFSITARNSHKVSVVKDSQEQDFIERFFAKDSNVVLQSFSSKQLNYQKMEGSNLLVLDALDNYSSGMNSELQKFVKAGANLLFIPKAENSNQALDQFLRDFQLPPAVNVDTSKLELAQVDMQSPLFKNVFDVEDGKLPPNTQWPYFKWRYDFGSGSPVKLNKEMLFRNDKALLYSFSLGQGTVYLFTAGLDKKQSNFGKHALYIPVLYNMMIGGLTEENYYYSVDDEVVNLVFDGQQSEEAFQLRQMESLQSFIPGIRRQGAQIQIFTEYGVKESGNYLLFNSGFSRVLAFNYSSDESKIDTYTSDELKEKLEKNNIANVQIIEGGLDELQGEIISTNSHNALWKIFIALALLFLVIEVFLLRFLK